MLFIATLCHLIAAVTVVLRVEYTPSFCPPGGTVSSCHSGDAHSFYFHGSTSLSVSRVGSSPSFALSATRYWSSPSYDLSVARVGFSPSLALSVARVGSSPSLELSTARVGEYSWNDVCCGAGAGGEPLSPPPASTMHLGPCSVVAFGYFIDFVASHFLGFCAFLLLVLRAFVSCCLRALVYVGLCATLFVGHCASFTVRCLRALPSVGLRVYYFVGHCALTVACCLCALFFAGFHHFVVLGRLAWSEVGFVLEPFAMILSSSWYCYMCFCFLFTSINLMFLGAFIMVFGVLSALLLRCMKPFIYVLLASCLVVGYYTSTLGTIIGDRALLALGVCAWYNFGILVPVFIALSLFIFTTYEVRIASQPFNVERFMSSHGANYMAYEETFNAYGNHIWPQIFSFGNFCLTLSCFLFDYFVEMGKELNSFETFVIAVLFFAIFRYGVRPFFMVALPFYFKRR